MTVKSFYRPSKLIVGTYGAANLVTSPDLLIGTIAITRIFVPPEYRGLGIASAMMRELLKDADESKTTLVLEIVPDETSSLNYDQLKHWYETCGFKLNKYGIMERKPR